MNKIAIVSIGETTGIMQEMLKYQSKADMYNISSRKTLENARYYSYNELEVLADVLEDYDTVVMTAKMGSKSGDVLVKLYTLLNNRKICFLIMPFYFEVEKTLISRNQISQIMHEDFEGAILSQSSVLSSTDLESALEKFDREMAEMILDFIPEL